jgi:tetratricopeptide (TPR) repeat protein
VPAVVALVVLIPVLVLALVLADPPSALRAAAAITVCVFGIAWGTRRLRLVQLARRPGPIEVATFDVGTDLEATRTPLMALFGNRLASVQLYSVSPQPGVKPSTTQFLSLLRDARLDLNKPLLMLADLLWIVWPAHAYETHVHLRRHEDEHHEIVVQTVRLPGRETQILTFREREAERAIERGAHAVAAFVLPVTKRVTAEPWSEWKNHRLDPDLFDLYQRTHQFLAARRLDEAMDAYYSLLRRDPRNRAFRYELGLVQEKLALFLDAIATYSSLFDKPGERIDDAVTLLARYRFTILLGFGERLARQWSTTGSRREWSDRDEERAALRARLRRRLRAYYEDLPSLHAEVRNLAPTLDPAAEPRVVLETMLAEPDQETPVDDVARLRLQLLFQVLAEEEVGRLLRDTRGADLEALDTGLTSLALDILPVWAELRRDRVKRRLADRQALATPAVADVDWPADEEHVRSRFMTSIPDGKGHAQWTDLLESRQFADQYNVACTLAIASDPSCISTSPTARAAVAALDRMAQWAGRDELVGKWSWVVSEDPDLDSLRRTDAFRDFEQRWFPAPRPTRMRPGNVHRLELSRYTAAVIVEGARMIERVWHERAARAGRVDVHEVMSWWRGEIAAWQNAARLAEHHRHWQTRVEVLRDLQAYADRHDEEPFVLHHPRYSDDPLDDPAMSAAALECADERCRALAAYLRCLDHDGTSLTRTAWAQHLAEIDRTGRRPSVPALRNLCDERAAAWDALEEWFRVAPHRVEPLRAAEREFARMVDALEGPVRNGR